MSSLLFNWDSAPGDDTKSAFHRAILSLEILPADALYDYQYKQTFTEQHTILNLTCMENNPFLRIPASSSSTAALSPILQWMFEVVRQKGVLSFAHPSNAIATNHKDICAWLIQTRNLLLQEVSTSSRSANRAQRPVWNRVRKLIQATPFTSYYTNLADWISSIGKNAAAKLDRLDLVTLLPMDNDPVLQIHYCEGTRNLYRNCLYQYKGFYHRSLLLHPKLQGNADELARAIYARFAPLDESQVDTFNGPFNSYADFMVQLNSLRHDDDQWKQNLFTFYRKNISLSELLSLRHGSHVGLNALILVFQLLQERDFRLSVRSRNFCELNGCDEFMVRRPSFFFKPGCFFSHFVVDHQSRALNELYQKYQLQQYNLHAKSKIFIPIAIEEAPDVSWYLSVIEPERKVVRVYGFVSQASLNSSLLASIVSLYQLCMQGVAGGAATVPTIEYTDLQSWSLSRNLHSICITLIADLLCDEIDPMDFENILVIPTNLAAYARNWFHAIMLRTILY